MSYKVYIIQSLKSGRYYIGSTEDVGIRLKRHNDGLIRSTKAYKPWQLVFTENFDTRQEAYRRERQIKSFKKGEAFKKLL